MIPLYYVNLASRPDRREFMDAQFARVGLAATRIEAVTPAATSITRSAIADASMIVASAPAPTRLTSWSRSRSPVSSVVPTSVSAIVPAGSEIEYVDLGTIAHALADRR